jgi:inhibitor of cysteine peptidase
MSRFTFFFLLILAVLVVVLGAFFLTRPQELILTEADAGQTIELEVGEEFAVKLAGNPTTGYTWKMATSEAAVVEQAGQSTYEEDDDNGRVGAGGYMTLPFKATRPGQQLLQLSYYRPWEEDVAPIGTFDVTIVVEE